MYYKFSLGIVFFLFSYLYISTGNHSDDIIHIVNIKESLSLILSDIFSTVLYLKAIPVMVYDFLQFYYFDFNSEYYDVVKILTSFIVFFAIYRFMQDYMGKTKALLFSLIFILFPLHDATNYWVVGQYLLITVALVMLSHKLINRENYIRGFLLGIVGSFSSYASLPFTLGLSIIFLLQREYKKFTAFIIPQIIYIAYYFLISKVFGTQAIKGNSSFDLITLLKQFILQVGTFIDVSIGPSFWLKIYYSVGELTLTSVILGIILVLLFYKYYEPKREKLNKNILFSFIAITLFAFGIFALTGFYPQMAFNLGNRVTIYGSLLVSFLLVNLFMNNKKIATLVFSIFIFSTLGISDHWKKWNETQLKLIENIATNKDINEFKESEQLFVTYNQYSQLGNMSHIEFFAQGMASHIFKLATKKDYNVSTLNRRFVYKDTYLLDKKFGVKIEIEDIVYVYDSKDNKMIEINKKNIQAYINTLPKDNRHWLQLLDNDNFIMKIVLKLMPRLEYAL